MKASKSVGVASMILFTKDREALSKTEEALKSDTAKATEEQPIRIERIAAYPASKNRFRNLVFSASLVELLYAFVLVRISDSGDVARFDRAMIFGGAYFTAAVATFYLSEKTVWQRYSYRSDRVRLSIATFVLWAPVIVLFVSRIFDDTAVFRIVILCILSPAVGAFMMVDTRRGAKCFESEVVHPKRSGLPLRKDEVFALISSSLLLCDLGAVAIFWSPERATALESESGTVLKTAFLLVLISAPLLFIRSKRLPWWGTVAALSPGIVFGIATMIPFQNAELVIALSLAVSETAIGMIIIDLVQSIWFNGAKPLHVAPSDS